MGILSSLNRQQKEAVGLLQIGTFLEYFDLMLYVHMAVLLNDLFFPKTDSHTAALLTAFAFCSVFVLRPFGALIFGWIGDNIGRKPTVIITTFMMSTACILMANLPTYAEIGITSAYIVIACRVIQGMSSMGEIIGAQIYATEITKPPSQYPAVACLALASDFGGMAALAIATLVTRFGFNWRIAFWIGAGVAVIGSMARTRLRETPEFLESNKLINKAKKKHPISILLSLEKKTLISAFCVYSGWPVCFYLAFLYVNPYLQSKFGYSPEDTIFHNFLLSIVGCLAVILWTFMSYKIHPLKILKFKVKIFFLTAILFPIVLTYSNSLTLTFSVQALVLAFALEVVPAVSIVIKHFSVLNRFTSVSFIFALTRAIVFVITSFGIVYLTEWFGHYGLWFISLTTPCAVLWGANHFIKLEKEAGNFPESSSSKKVLLTG